MEPFPSIRRQVPGCSCDLSLYVDDSSNFNLTQRYIVVTILGVSIYNCVELIPYIFATFKRYKGLYFWSLLVSILGILMANVSNLVSNFYPNPPRLQIGFIALFGWAFMVTGQSLVLYSRLDLLPLGDKTRRWVLRIIIFNAIVMQVPIIVLNTGSKSARPDRFLPAFAIYERIQIIVFFLQEMGLSCVYLWECFRFLVLPEMPVSSRTESGSFDNTPQKNSRKVLLHLLLVSIAVIVLDITVIALEFSGFHIIQISYKELAYSIKLKLEISVLNRLVKFVQSRPMGSSGRITTQDDLDGDLALQHAFYSHQCDCRVEAGNGKSEAGRSEHTTKDAQSQQGPHGGNRVQTHTVQGLTVENIA